LDNLSDSLSANIGQITALRQIHTKRR